MRRLVNLIALAIVVGALLNDGSGLAHADTVTYSFTPGIDATVTDFSMIAKAQKFDLSLGTLESVEISYTSKISAIMTITNTGTGKTTGYVDTEVLLGLTDPKNQILQFNDVTTNVESFSVSKAVGTKNYPSTGTDKGTNTSDVTYTAPKILNEFTGKNKIDLTVSTLTGYQLEILTGDASASTIATANAKGFVTYTYIAVPEPSTLLLSGIAAVVGLGTWARRRRGA